MHQLLKGVAKDLLEFLFEVSGYPVEIENATKALKLPSEFKRSVRSLHELKHFKANELKTYLLYLTPIVFRPVLNDTSFFRDLCYLVFAVRSLYDSNRNSSFCGMLIEAFCKNIHFKFPGRFLSLLTFFC